MITIERISDKHFRMISNFDCGIQEAMTYFLKTEAYDYDQNGEGNTYLVIEDNKTIVGYYTLKCNAVQIQDPECDAETKVIPAVEIARFAVDAEYQHNGKGQRIFAHIVKKINELREHIGIKYIILFALPEAETFYSENFNFLKFDDDAGILISTTNKGCIGMYAIL